jgi:hypothetical protein
MRTKYKVSSDGSDSGIKNSKLLYGGACGWVVGLAESAFGRNLCHAVGFVLVRVTGVLLQAR